MKKILLSLLLISLFISGKSQTDTTSLYDLNLEELMNIPISTGNIKETSIRETPGIISIITAEDIRKMGARDLIDVLQNIPGFQFGSDIETYVGLGLRGLWCSEARVSVFIDDHEINDLGYGTVPFGNHFCIDQIEKIEIIRGPGSAMYGGTSQYGVIKITTKNASLNGFEVSNTFGEEPKKMDFRNDHWIPRNNFNLQFGRQMSQGAFYLSVFSGSAQRSSGEYIDFYNLNKVPFDGNSAINSYSVSLNGRYKNIKASFLYDNYCTYGTDLYGMASSVPVALRFLTTSANIQYEKKIQNFTIKPIVSFKSQNPWYSMDTISYGYPYVFDHTLTRLNPRLDLIYSPNDIFEILVGGQYYIDHGTINKNDPNLPDSSYASFSGKRDEVSYTDFNTYLQSTINLKGFRFTLGGRYESHSFGFNSIVPRFALTRAFKKFHVKLLAAQSFKNPLILNIQDYNIKPEKATIIECELGYKISANIFLQADAFKISTQDMLFYTNDPVTNTGGYYNSELTSGSMGVEAEMKIMVDKFNANLSYSYYNFKNNKIPTFMPYGTGISYLIGDNITTNAPAGIENYSLGFAPHKIVANLNYNITSKININLNTMMLGKRYGYEYATYDSLSNESLFIREYKPVFISSLVFNFNQLLNSGFDISIGVHNLLDEKYGYITPYLAYHGQVPAMGRELVVKVTYKIKS